MPFLFSVLVILLMVGALVDIITRESRQVRHLPKMVWIILVLLLPLLGSILWFTVGRDFGDGGVPLPRPHRRAAAAPLTETIRLPAADTRTTEQQIADLDREIEEWRLREEIAKRKKENGEP